MPHPRDLQREQMSRACPGGGGGVGTAGIDWCITLEQHIMQKFREHCKHNIKIKFPLNFHDKYQKLKQDLLHVSPVVSSLLSPPAPPPPSNAISH